MAANNYSDDDDDEDGDEKNLVLLSTLSLSRKNNNDPGKQQQHTMTNNHYGCDDEQNEIIITNDDKKVVKVCCILGVLCSVWNLVSDLYLYDFLYSHTNHEDKQDFGKIRDQTLPGYLWWREDNSHSHHEFWSLFVQASGWIYPLWAIATILPLWIGFRRHHKAIAPLGLLAYGLCVVGGALHNAFVFVMILPSLVHHDTPAVDIFWKRPGKTVWADDLHVTNQFFRFLETAQSRILKHVFWGAGPGMLALMIAFGWILVLVLRTNNSNLFPKRFVLFNPIVTMVWAKSFVALLKLPTSVNFYVGGCLGTFTLLVLHLGIAHSFLCWSSLPLDETLDESLVTKKSKKNSNSRRSNKKVVKNE